MADACCGPAEIANGDNEKQTSTPAIQNRHHAWWRAPGLRLPLISGAFLALGYAFLWMVPGITWLSVGAHAASVLAGAATFVPGTLRRLFFAGKGTRRLSVGTLMSIAALGAILLGHVAEAAALAFLFSLAEAFEDLAMDRARDRLSSLLELIPDTALARRGAGVVSVKVSDIRTGETLVIGAGERIPTDTLVLEGASTLDTSAVTGESIPIAVTAGQEAPAGSINGSGLLVVVALAPGVDNSLTQIVELVSRAHQRKGDRARLADSVARPLVPTVLVVAAAIMLSGLVTGETGLWTERALVVLVAASPCALAIAVPVTVISAIGAASRLGVVVKSGAAMEELGRIGTIAFDKTGTLTRNQPEVVDVVAAPGFTRAEVLGFAAALETASSHPLAAAITRTTPPSSPASQVTEVPGHGVSGLVGSRHVRLGNQAWLSGKEWHPGHQAASDDTVRISDSAASEFQTQGKTVVHLEVDGARAGLIAIRDELRPEAADTVAELREAGFGVVMLSGDTHETAVALAREAGITEVSAGQRPAQKAEAVTELMKRNPTAMVGDGINDAPALATATVGIAMGLRGSAAAVASADVAFTGTDLRLIPRALLFARRARTIMTANVVLALTIIVVLFPLALLGVLGLAGVVLVHEVAEVLVILNGLRAGRTVRAGRGPKARRSGGLLREQRGTESRVPGT